MNENYVRLKDMIAASGNIVFFGGAGISTESGIPDFRSNTGLYAQKFMYPAETMLSYSFFASSTEDFFDFYRNCMLYPDAEPCLAHRKLAELEAQGKLKAVITQNIDGLHQKAGSENVLELHGSVLRNFCTECGKPYDLDYIMDVRPVPKCTCGGVVKPDVVLYEESLDMDILKAAASYIQNADVLIIGGTSLAVYPAASLVDYYNGGKLVLINKTPTSRDGLADLVFHESISEVLAQCC